MFFLLQSTITNPGSLPSWISGGPLPFIITLVILLFVFGIWLNLHLKRVQANLRELGEKYFEKERLLLDRFKSGELTRDEYRKEHEKLVDRMREESRSFTD